MRCERTQSRKKRRPLQRRASGILHNVYQRRSAQTGKQSEVHRPEEQNGRFTIGVLFEVEFINNLTATQYRRSGEIQEPDE